MNRQQHLLDIIIEECAEVTQRVTKAKRFGLDEIQPDQMDNKQFDNLKRIIYEMNDLVAVMDVLCADKERMDWLDEDMIEAKKAKIEKYLKYSSEIGTLLE